MASSAPIIDPRMTRTVPGWNNAPVPVCFGGDPRALTFCCDPRKSLAFAAKCAHAAMLDRIGLSEKRYLAIKRDFTREHDLAHTGTCFGSLAFCCLRRRGCPSRDAAIHNLLDGDTKRYFRLKRTLAVRLLEAASRDEIVRPYLDLEAENAE